MRTESSTRRYVTKRCPSTEVRSNDLKSRPGKARCRGTATSPDSGAQSRGVGAFLGTKENGRPPGAADPGELHIQDERKTQPPPTAHYGARLCMRTAPRSLLGCRALRPAPTPSFRTPPSAQAHTEFLKLFAITHSPTSISTVRNTSFGLSEMEVGFFVVVGFFSHKASLKEFL